MEDVKRILAECMLQLGRKQRLDIKEKRDVRRYWNEAVKPSLGLCDLCLPISNIEYFMDKLDDVYADHYEPTQLDLANYRIVHNREIRLENIQLTDGIVAIVDPGDSLSRRNTMHLFNESTCLIYVLDVGTFHKKPMTYLTSNAIEAGEVHLMDICNTISASGGNKNILVLLNKVDLLSRNLEKHPFKVEHGKYPRFIDYDGATTSSGSSVELVTESVLEYLTTKITSIVTTYCPSCSVRIQALSALDTEQVQATLPNLISQLLSNQ